MSEPRAVATGSSAVSKSIDPIAMLRTLTSLLSQRGRKEAPGSDTNGVVAATGKCSDINVSRRSKFRDRSELS